MTGRLAHRWLSPIPGRVKQISSWLQPLLRSYRQSRANDIDECGQDSELQADEQVRLSIPSHYMLCSVQLFVYCADNIYQVVGG